MRVCSCGARTGSIVGSLNYHPKQRDRKGPSGYRISYSANPADPTATVANTTTSNQSRRCFQTAVDRVGVIPRLSSHHGDHTATMICLWRCTQRVNVRTVGRFDKLPPKGDKATGNRYNPASQFTIAARGKLMSEENKALVRRFVEEVQSHHDLDALDELFHPEMVNHTVPHGLDVPPGIEGFKQFYSGMINAFPDVYATINQQFSDGDKVITYKTFHGASGPYLQLPRSGPCDVLHTMASSLPTGCRKSQSRRRCSAC